MSKNKEVSTPLPVDAYDERQIHYRNLAIRTRNLSGKILTIIDASIIDRDAKKAVKDLVKNEIREFLYHYQDYCSKGNSGEGVPDSVLENNQ